MQLQPLHLLCRVPERGMEVCVCVLSVNSTDPDEYNIILNISKIGVCVCVHVYKRNWGGGEEENEKETKGTDVCV